MCIYNDRTSNTPVVLIMLNIPQVLSMEQLMTMELRDCLVWLFSDEGELVDAVYEIPDVSVPAPEYTKQELINFILFVKNAEETFLPEYWSYRWLNNKRKCYTCGSDALYYYPNLNTEYDYPTPSCLYFARDDDEELHDLVLDLNHYCDECFRPLYCIFDVENE